MKLDSEFFESLPLLVAERDRLKRDGKEREDREKITRGFYNGRPLMTEEEADEENLGSVTNHLTGYSALQVAETRFYGMWANSNRIVDVNITLGEDEVAEEAASNYISKYLNKAIRKTARFGSFWRSVAGELVISGRAPCVFSDDDDWCPSVEPMLMLPDSVGVDASDFTYAFIPRALTVHHLNLLKDNADVSDDEVMNEMMNDAEVNTEAIDNLIDEIKRKVESGEDSRLNEDDRVRRDDVGTDEGQKKDRTAVTAWYYYESRYDEDVEDRVIDLIIFSESFSTGDEDSPHVVLAKFPARFKAHEHFLHPIVCDASIAGAKRYATSKGIADITYNSDIEVEELLNKLFEGEKIRATPKFRATDTGSIESLLGWDPVRDTFMDNIEEVPLRHSAANLNGPLALMRQNSSSISGSGFSNTSGSQELRVQAVRREGQDLATQAVRIADVFLSMDILMEEIVRRFFVGSVDPKSSGYKQIMWFRKMMKKNNIDLKKLAKSEYGFFEYIEVRSIRSSSSGENDIDLVVAERLVAQLSNFPAAVRPMIMHRFVAMVSGDPHLADRLVEVLPKIVSAQRVTAESEFEQIGRNALLEEDTPLGVDDVHQEHTVIHIKQLQVLVREGEEDGWTHRHVRHFAGLQSHTMLHIEELLSNNTTVAEGQELSQALSQVVSAGEALRTQFLDKIDSDGRTQLEIDREHAERELQLKEREQERKEIDTQSNSDARDKRQQGIDRKADQSFLLDRERLKTNSK